MIVVYDYWKTHMRAAYESWKTHMIVVYDHWKTHMIFVFDMICFVPSKIFQLCRVGLFV